MRRVVGLAIAAFAAAALAFPGIGSAAGTTVVSLTFDDGWGTQQVAATSLAAHGMTGTFYINTPSIGQPDYLTWSQLDAFDAAGDEIGGHTLTHPDLTTLSSAEAAHEICDDRSNLTTHGFTATSFAYPFGAYDASTSGSDVPLDASPIVQSCGYTSGRGAYGLHKITLPFSTSPPYAISTSPANKFKIIVPCCINNFDFGPGGPTAAALEDYVAHAESATSPAG